MKFQIVEIPAATIAKAESLWGVSWEVDGDPLAIITLPLAEPGDKRNIILRSLQLLPGKAVASGTVEEREMSPQEPTPGPQRN